MTAPHAERDSGRTPVVKEGRDVALDEIDALLSDAVDKLTTASELVVDTPLEPVGENSRKLSAAVRQVFEVQLMICKAPPDLAANGQNDG